MSATPDLWKCPKCGHRFVTPNLWHSCGRYRIDDHFVGKDPRVRELFDRLEQVMRSFGPVNVYAQKTSIVFQVRVRFARAMPKKQWLDGHFWLKRRGNHVNLTKVQHMRRQDWIHWFRLRAPDDLDKGFVKLLRESYTIGEQTGRSGSNRFEWVRIGSSRFEWLEQVRGSKPRTRRTPRTPIASPVLSLSSFPPASPRRGRSSSGSR
jgi:hypothetical protein